MIKTRKSSLVTLLAVAVMISSISMIGAVSQVINIDVVETKRLDLTFIPIDNPDSFYIVNDCGCKEVMIE